MKSLLSLFILLLLAAKVRAEDPTPGAKNLGYVTILRGTGDDVASYALFELWGFDKPTDHDALVSSVAKAYGFTDVLSGKVWGRKSYYDLQEKLLKEIPKNLRSASSSRNVAGSIITAQANPNAIAQRFEKFLSNDYPLSVIPASTRSATPRLLGSIIVSCGPKDATMTSFKVYEWYGTGLPRNTTERYGNMHQSVNTALGISDETGCKMNDTVTGLIGEAAKEAFYRRIKGIRKWVSASVVNVRITTDNDCKVVSTEPIGGSSTASGGSGGGGRSSGSTSDGISYSSADMSQFTNNSRLGAMILYYGSGGVANSAYIYDLRGRELKDKAGVAGILSARTAGSTFIGFEHRPGDCRAAEGYVQGKVGKSISTHCMGEYKVD